MGPRRRAGLMVAILLAAGIVALGPIAAAEESADGPVNLGFEEPWTTGAPLGWHVSEDTSGVFVVDEETPDDSPSYLDPALTISPHAGDQMLRIGTPKAVAETQASGRTTVTQTFTADGTQVSVAARILSWEFRDNDSVTIDAVGASWPAGQSVTFFAGRVEETCDRLPCTFSIARDKRAGLLDSGWVPVDLDTTAGADVTLSYTIEGTSNNSHATWGYFDAPSLPPVASFTSDPPDGALVPEGSHVQLQDASFDPDATDEIVAWDWQVTGPDGTTPLTSGAPDPSFVPPQDGPYEIALQVTSSDGQHRAVEKVLHVANAPALVNALDVEVLSPDDDVPVSARYLDAGWLDTHTVTVAGGNDIDVTPDSRPGLTLGRISATLPAGSTSTEVTVDDGDGGLASGSSDTVDVTVIGNDPMRDEVGGGDDTLAGTVPPVVADVSRLSWLQEAGDVDIVEVQLAGGELLAGTEIVAALDEVPADYDLVLLSLPPGAPPAVAGYQMAPYQMAAYQMAPYQMAPYQMAPIERAAYQMAPYQMAPYQMAELGLSAYQMAPYLMAPYQMAPLSGDPSVTASVTGGGDIDAAELGVEALLASQPGLQVAGFSANRGVGPESALVRVDEPGTRLFVAVLGANGAHNASTPYRMRLESSAPWSSVATADAAIHATLSEAYCSGDPLVTTADPVPAPAVDLGGAPARTLIVTQLDRLRAAHPQADWPSFDERLRDYAQHPLVQGRILSVDASAYDDWDRSPCDVDEANGVTEHVRDAVRAELVAAGNAFEYLVILGDDSIVPFRRTSSGAVIGDESQYLGGSFLQPGSPLAAALASSQELTDDYYSDLEPLPFQSGDLYLPDLATGRLVETPGEIADAMDAFVTSGGRLDAGTALVTAHDFLADGGETIAGSLAGRAEVVSDLREDWTSDSVRCQWLGDAGACTSPELPATPDIVSPNSHWTHYASLSANGFAAPDHDDVLTSEELAAAAAPTTQLVFTIGCHAGFSVPDAQSLDGSANGIDPALDFAQSLARRQAVFVASTGFGLGDTEGLAGTELLMAGFAEELLVQGVTAGEALRAAKRSYLGALSTTSTYDVKSLVQQTLYGPPQYQVFAEGAAASSSPVSPSSLSSDVPPDGHTTFSFTPETTATGASYWSIAGDVQVTPGRPWQPRAVLPVGPDTHGVLVTGGRFHDEHGVQPVVTRPTVEWEQGTSELDDVCRDSWWPADLTTVNEESIVVVPGQFRCVDPATGAGTQRLYDALTLEVLESSSADVTPPAAGPLDLRGTGPDVVATIPASDASDISRIVVLALQPTTGLMRSVDVSTPVPDEDGVFEVTIPGLAGSGEEFVVQVVDGANNVTILTGRGANLHYLAVTAAGPETVEAGSPATFTGAIADWTGPAGDHEYVWDFGDGTTATGMLADLGVDQDGRFGITHVYGADWGGGTATLRVWDVDGGTGTADVEVPAVPGGGGGGGLPGCDPEGDVTPGFEWGDLVGCAVGEVGGVLTFSVGTSLPASPAGSYRLEVDTAPGSRKPSLTQLKFDPATQSVTGPSSLTVTVADEGHTLHFSVDAKEIGFRGDALAWRAYVQSGQPGSSGDGIIDRLPDGDPDWLSWPPAG